MMSKLGVLLFSALSLGFFVRFAQFGYKWLCHASSPDFNYKALTAWSAIYVVVCAAIAWTIYELSKPEGEANETLEAPPR